MTETQQFTFQYNCLLLNITFFVITTVRYRATTRIMEKNEYSDLNFSNCGKAIFFSFMPSEYICLTLIELFKGKEEYICTGLKRYKQMYYDFSRNNCLKLCI